jgi:hypothetical protein
MNGVRFGGTTAMSSNPEVDGLVSLRPYAIGPEGDWSESPPLAAPVAQPEAPPPAYYPAAIPQPAVNQHAAVDTPKRRGWIGLVAVAVIGLIVAGTLGYFLYTTTGQRDAALRYGASTKATLTSTEATLASTQSSLSTSQADLAARNAIAAYTTMYLADSARVNIDYEKVVACASFGACRTAAQSALTDLQAFQADRAAATVPPALANSDAMLRDALSAAIAANQQLISGFDNFNASKVGAGFKKLNAAMLSVAKAEAVLGAALK